MGIDLLDVVFRLEKRYGVKIPHADLLDAARNRQPGDITAGEIQFFVGAELHQQGRPIPPSLWHGVQRELAEALGKPIREIKPESWLIKELGMS